MGAAPILAAWTDRPLRVRRDGNLTPFANAYNLDCQPVPLCFSQSILLEITKSRPEMPLLVCYSKKSAVMHAGVVRRHGRKPRARAIDGKRGTEAGVRPRQGQLPDLSRHQGRRSSGHDRAALEGHQEQISQRNELVAILTDETKRNPLTGMPPFGRNRILTEQEINAIVDFLQTL